MYYRRLLVALFLCCSCSFNARNLVPTSSPDIKAMLDSTVQVTVAINATISVTDEDTKEVTKTDIDTGWRGSGVVYDKTEGLLAPIHSQILTANHVLNTPAVGDVITSGLMSAKINSVVITLRTADGRTCNVEPLVLGEDTPEDVATGDADCDAGRVASIASEVPGRGNKIFISGHSVGSPVALVTDGYVSGWMDGYLLVSAAAAPGNSGGPVFNSSGEVIGLLVRGSPRYPHMSMATPLKSIVERIKTTREPRYSIP